MKYQPCEFLSTEDVQHTGLIVINLCNFLYLFYDHIYCSIFLHLNTYTLFMFIMVILYILFRPKERTWENMLGS